MNPEQLNALGNTIKDAIAAISEKLGVASSHVYEILIRQQLVMGIVGLVAPIVLAICVYLFIRSMASWTKAHAKWTKDVKGKYGYERDDEPYPIFPFITGGIGFMAALGTAATMAGTIGRICNPEYYALLEIVRATSALVK